MEMSSLDGASSNEPLSSGGPIGVKRRAAQFEQLVRLNKGREMIRMTNSAEESPGSDGIEMVEREPSSDVLAPEDDFEEVHFVLRVPKQGGSQEADLLALQEQCSKLQIALERKSKECEAKEKERKKCADSLKRRTQEWENLMRVVRELTESRSKLVSTKASLQDSLSQLQHEYFRVLRMADLSRVVSQEQMAKSAKSQKGLQKADEEIARHKKLVTHYRERSRALKQENGELRERIGVLERLGLLQYSTESVCMREFARLQLKETY